MLEFISLLRQRYQAVLLQLNENSEVAATFRQRVEQLTFTESFIRKGLLLKSGSSHLPLQIAIIGPTQAGKSSVCNAILSSQVAGVSPLAGYTVHAQGFCANISLSDCYELQNYFGRYQQLSPSALSKTRYDCYGLAQNPHSVSLLPPCVFWDTPDFDSIDSSDYKEGVIRAIALADIIVLVVSKEKYADQSVWEMMAIIEGLHQPSLVCINKLNWNSEEIIIRSLQEKWQQVRSDAFPEVVPLFYEKSGMPVWPTHCEKIFFQLAKKVDHRKHKQLQQTLIHQHWQTWLEPVLGEHQALKDWQALIYDCINQALLEYQRDYLNHPHHYQTFQLALAELLHLLEVPGLATILSSVRRALTWPVRQLFQFGKTKPELYATHELALLNQIGEHFFIQVADQLLEKTDVDNKQQSWWQELYRLVRQQRGAVLQEFNQAALSYHHAFQQDVEATARQLYQRLEQQPLILNSLRATRITTDTAMMALVLQTGGIGLADLFLTPAMLSITSLLAESAIGGYIKTVEADLKQQQLDKVKGRLFMTVLHQALYQMPEQMPDHNRFAISPEQLHQAEQQRIEKRHGLRLF
jgi:hypothetical protein